MTIATKGQHALACLGGPWVEVTIDRANADGTYDVIPVGEERSFMARWHGVTASELSIDDASQWPAVAARHREGASGLGWAGAQAVFRVVGAEVSDADMQTAWRNRGRELTGAELTADGLVVDDDTAYRLFRSFGYAAAILADPARDPAQPYFKMYWNQVRMGGRDPADVGRAITLDDALAAAALAEVDVDPAATAALLAFEAANGVTLPAALTALWSRVDAIDALRDVHCNNPEPRAVDAWTLRRDLADATGTRYALHLIDPHQGSHGWWLAFEDGAADGAVWASFAEDGPPVVKIADSLAFFWWDLASTNAEWLAASNERVAAKAADA